MFGYLTVNLSELKMKDIETYRGFYCGTCRELAHTYGKTGQVILSYDITFLAILLSSLYEPETASSKGVCVLHPAGGRLRLRNAYTEYAADMGVLLSSLKCEDDERDDNKAAAKMLGKKLKRSLKNAGKGKLSDERRARLIEKSEAIKGLLSELYDMEKAEERDADAISGQFGRVLSEVFLYRQDEWSDELYMMGFYLGKWIYLMDAYEDAGEDHIKGRYNPFADKVTGTEKRKNKTTGRTVVKAVFKEGFEDEFKELMTVLAGDFCRQFERLPLVEYTDILRNILYSGIWARYKNA